MLLSARSASAEDNNPFPWADERFASAATQLSHFTSTENGWFFPEITFYFYFHLLFTALGLPQGFKRARKQIIL